MTSMKELKKREVIMAVTQVVNIPKYTVLGHQTSDIIITDSNGSYDHNLEKIPDDCTNIMVIYLKK